MRLLYQLKHKVGRSFFWVALRVMALFEMPALGQEAKNVYKKVLTRLAIQGPLDIFEYGSGFSTIYFAKFLEKKGIPFHIYSVENNRLWYEKVLGLLKKAGLEDKVSLFLFEFPPFWDKNGWDWSASAPCRVFAPQMETEDSYITTPLNLGKKFDIVFVDGRFRRRCLEIVSKCLKPEGIVLLDDAQKEQYHSSLALYPYAKFIRAGRYYPGEKTDRKIWLGSYSEILHEIS